MEIPRRQDTGDSRREPRQRNPAVAGRQRRLAPATSLSVMVKIILNRWYSGRKYHVLKLLDSPPSHPEHAKTIVVCWCFRGVNVKNTVRLWELGGNASKKIECAITSVVPQSVQTKHGKAIAALSNIKQRNLVLRLGDGCTNERQRLLLTHCLRGSVCLRADFDDCPSVKFKHTRDMMPLN